MCFGRSLCAMVKVLLVMVLVMVVMLMVLMVLSNTWAGLLLSVLL